jgi:hypothetical protein
MSFFTNLLDNTIVVGRNVFLKNNLESLYRMKTPDNKREKIDHTLGTTDNVYHGDFNTSKCGIHAKDVSDSLVQALWASVENDDVYPITVYKDFKKKKRKSQKPSTNTNHSLSKVPSIIEHVLGEEDYKKTIEEARLILNKRF